MLQVLVVALSRKAHNNTAAMLLLLLLLLRFGTCRLSQLRIWSQRSRLAQGGLWPWQAELTRHE